MKISTRITELESILTNHPDLYYAEELATMEAELYKIRYIDNLWGEFGDLPMNPETERIEQEWNHFPVGTHREDIWHWFEECFGISVATDLMGF